MINCAIIGMGKAGFFYDYPKKKNQIFSHAYAYKEIESLKLVAFSEIKKKKLNICEKILNVHGYQYYDDMFKNEKIDIVSICTPDETHEKILNDLLIYKPKLVICEKPIGLSINTSKKIIDRYKINNIPIFVNYFRRWDKKILNLKKKIQHAQAININYSKGIIHSGTHYIDLLSVWFGRCLEYKNIQLVEKINKSDFTLNFDLIYKTSTGKKLLVSFNGMAKNNDVDEILIYFPNQKINIINSRTINYLYNNKKFSEDTNFNNIIVQIVKTISKKIYLKKRYIKSNAYESYQCLKLAIKIINQINK